MEVTESSIQNPTIQLELVPYADLDPVTTSEKFFDLLQDPDTRAEMERIMPNFVSSYGGSPENAFSRYQEVVNSSKLGTFLPLVQLVNGEVAGSATIDSRMQPYHFRIAPGLHAGKIEVVGPSTSSWLARPFQGLGLGRQSLKKRTQLALNEWDHRGLWLKARNDNQKSKGNIEARGFRKIYDGKLWLAGEKHPATSIYQYKP